MKIFASIESLPIWNFYKIKETSDITFLFIDEERHGGAITEKEGKELFECWKAIESRFITSFGLNDKFINRLILEQKILLLELDVAIKKDSISKSRLNIELDKLRQADEDAPKGSIVDTVVTVEKFMSFAIDEKVCTVAKFFGYISMMRNVKQYKAADNG